MMQFLPILSILLLGVTLQDLVAQQAGILPVLDRKIDYASDVAPIFEKHCVIATELMFRKVIYGST